VSEHAALPAPLTLTNDFRVAPLIERLEDEFSSKRAFEMTAGWANQKAQADGKALCALQA
jgi:hypothetical protein